MLFLFLGYTEKNFDRYFWTGLRHCFHRLNWMLFGQDFRMAGFTGLFVLK